MNKRTKSALVFSLLVFGLLEAAEPDIQTCLPWTDRVGMTIGMDRKKLEKLRPNAKFLGVGGGPNEVTTGTYLESEPGKNKPRWMYNVTKDKLTSVAWSIGSNKTGDKKIIGGLAKLRAQLNRAHSAPTSGFGLRIHREHYSRIRQEIFRPKGGQTVIVLTATSQPGMTEVGIQILSESDVSRFSYKDAVKQFDTSEGKEDTVGKVITDLLRP